MINMWVVYLLTRVDEIKHFVSNMWIFPVLFFMALAYAGFFILFFFNKKLGTDESLYDEKWRKAFNEDLTWIKKHIRIGIILTVIFGFFYAMASFAAVLIPTRNEAAVIYVVPKVVNSDFVQKDLPAESKEMYGLAKQWLKDAVRKHGEEKPIPVMK